MDIAVKIDEQALQEKDDHNQNVVVSSIFQVREHDVEVEKEDNMEICNGETMAKGTENEGYGSSNYK